MTKKQHKPDVCKISYVINPWTVGEDVEGYGVYYKFADEDDFTMQSFYRLVRREGQSSECKPEFIHWRAIDEINTLVFSGFRFIGYTVDKTWNTLSKKLAEAE